MAGNGPVIGIDLGTTYSCVAIWQHGQAEIIANDQGDRITPSLVVFTDEQRFVGNAAKNEAARYPTNTIFDAKRLIGMSFHDPSVQSDMKYWPFKVIHNPEDDKAMIAVRCNDEEKHFAPEQISAMVLAKMKQTAEKFLGATVTKAVVTVPAYFNDSQRRATKDAANIAGLTVIQIINEPTAAAIAYGLGKEVVDTEKNVLVFDLGGGTFDVSVLSIKRGIYRVIAVSGDTHLGGQDFDNRMVAYLVDFIKSKYHKDISLNPRALGRLKTECERVKRVLSSNTHASLDVYGLLDGDDFHYTFTKAKFDELNIELFRKCLALTNTCLIDAKMDKDEIHDVVLVGGSTRIQKVQELLREFFNGKELCHSINADEAVAQGAAIRAANLCDEGIENVHQIVLCDVTPLSLGWQGLEEVYHVVIPKNTSIPYRKTWTVTTSVDNQITMHFRIYQGESPKAPDNHYLGEFNLSGVRPARRGVATAELCFDIDSSGMLEVSAVEMVNGSRNAIIFSNEKGRLSHYEINRMLTDAQNADAKDNEFKRRLEAKNAFETYIVDMRKLIRDDRIAGKLKTCQKNRIENAIDEATTWINSKNSDKIDAADYKIIIKFLESIWDPIIDEHAGFDGGSGTSDEGGALSKKERERKWFRKIGIAFGIQVGALVLDVVLAALGVPVPMIGSIIDNLQPP